MSSAVVQRFGSGYIRIVQLESEPVDWTVPQVSLADVTVNLESSRQPTPGFKMVGSDPRAPASYGPTTTQLGRVWSEFRWIARLGSRH
ncbi:hypothetical protein VTO42DRAFT_1251 [Malbranchea cinnamomea]